MSLNTLYAVLIRPGYLLRYLEIPYGYLRDYLNDTLKRPSRISCSGLASTIAG
jgi:hypothetical protein